MADRLALVEVAARARQQGCASRVDPDRGDRSVIRAPADRLAGNAEASRDFADRQDFVFRVSDVAHALKCCVCRLATATLSAK